MKIKCKFNRAARAYIAVQDMHSDVHRKVQNAVKRDDPFRDGKPYGQLEHERLVRYVHALREAALHKLHIVKPLPTCATS